MRVRHVACGLAERFETIHMDSRNPFTAETTAKAGPAPLRKRAGDPGKKPGIRAQIGSE